MMLTRVLVVYIPMSALLGEVAAEGRRGGPPPCERTIHSARRSSLGAEYAQRCRQLRFRV